MKLPDLRLPNSLEMSLWAVSIALLIPISVFCFNHAWGLFRLGLLAMNTPLFQRTAWGTLLFSSIGTLGSVALAYALHRAFSLGQQLAEEMNGPQASTSMALATSMVLWIVIFFQVFSVTWLNLQPLQL